MCELKLFLTYAISMQIVYVCKNTLRNTDVIGSIELFAGEEDLESYEIREVYLHASFSFFFLLFNALSTGC